MTDRRLTRPVTDKRKQTFLEALAATGSTAAAAEAATPWSTHRQGGLSAFRDAAKRDPEFAAAWTRAEQAALAKVEAEAMRRTMTPTLRPVFAKGELVGHVEEYDNRLLMAVLRRYNPAWSEKQQIEHTGEVQHQHQHAHVMAVLTPEDVLALPPADRQQLAVLLGRIADHKEALEVRDGNSRRAALPAS